MTTLGTYISGLLLVPGAQESSSPPQIVLLLGRNPNFLSRFLGSYPKKSDTDSNVLEYILSAWSNLGVTCLFLGAEKLLYSPDCSVIWAKSQLSVSLLRFLSQKERH